MTTQTRRARTHAAPPPYRRAWTAKAACSGQALDDFFSESSRAQNRARVLCRACPVLGTCLDEVTGLEDESRYGVYGGLNSDQRKALRWEVALHGRPNIDQAQLLVSSRFAELLDGMRWATPDDAAARLLEHGVRVDSSTARLALWWMGYKGARVQQRAPFQPVDREPQRIVDLCADTIRRLRSMEATIPDVAAYLGVAQTHCGVAINMIETTDDAALRAEMELEAAA